MNKFTSAYYYEIIAGGNRKLATPLLGYSERLQSYFEIPTGYVSNGNSRPSIFRKLIRKWGFDEQAVTLHDFIFDYEGLLLTPGYETWLLPPIRFHKLTLKEANLLYYDFAIITPNKLKARLCYAGLVLGSKSRWNELRRTTPPSITFV